MGKKCWEIEAKWAARAATGLGGRLVTMTDVRGPVSAPGAELMVQVWLLGPAAGRVWDGDGE